MKLRVKLLSSNGVLPKRGSALSAGYDLSAAHAVVIPKHGKALVKTDVAIACPENTYGRIAPRSGLAWKNFIDVGAGVIDADYRGNVGVLLFNHSEVDFKVEVGDRVAQLILEQCLMIPVEECNELEDTVRGEGGYGSTGIKSNNVVEATDENKAVNETKRSKQQ